MPIEAAWIYTLIPVAAAIMGATVAAYRRPGPVLASAIQHFAAGVVFAAAAGETLPSLKHGTSIWPSFWRPTARCLIFDAAEVRCMDDRRLTKRPIGATIDCVLRSLQSLHCYKSIQALEFSRPSRPIA